MARLIGDSNAFWNAAVLGGAANSAELELSQRVENFQVWINSTAAVAFKIQVGHHGDLSSEGIPADAAPTVWHDLYYGTTLQTVTPGAGVPVSILVPDIAFRWVRLNAAGATTVTAGWSGKGE